MLARKLAHYTLILGSQSPRRKELLHNLGLSFKVVVMPDVDESYPSYLKEGKIVEYISKQKAKAYQSLLKEDDLLITADTIVWLKDKVLGKPRNEMEAIDMLTKLSNTTHHVYTGVTLTTLNYQKSFSVDTEVSFSKLTEEEIRYYVANYQPYDKAGAYGIQEWIGYIGIERIDGSFYNVMGLPVKQVYENLKEFLVQSSID